MCYSLAPPASTPLALLVSVFLFSCSQTCTEVQTFSKPPVSHVGMKTGKNSQRADGGKNVNKKTALHGGSVSSCPAPVRLGPDATEWPRNIPIGAHASDPDSMRLRSSYVEGMTSYPSLYTCTLTSPFEISSGGVLYPIDRHVYSQHWGDQTTWARGHSLSILATLQ